jgi:uncharacterized membrane protein
MKDFQMLSPTQNTLLKAACMGAVAGMRSVLAPALVTKWLADGGRGEALESPYSLLASRRTASVASTLSKGEIIFDKLPVTPPRISPAPLAARAVSGAVCGATICKVAHERAYAGAFVGAGAAVGTAFLVYYLRQSLGRKLPVPDAVLGGIEDSAAYAIGHSVLNAD